MNYGDLKRNIINLGFADALELEAFGSLVPDGINRAISEINQSFPYIAYLEFDKDSFTDEQYLFIDMTEYDSGFLEFVDTPVKYASDSYKIYNDFEIEAETVIVINTADLKEGTLRVFYKKEHPQFSLETEEDEDILLPLKCHHLIPLLSAYYIWLDDDATKSAYYKNQYDEDKMELLTPRPRMRIYGGGI